MSEVITNPDVSAENQFSHSSVFTKLETVGVGEEQVEKEFSYLQISVGDQSSEEDISELGPEQVEQLRKYIEAIIKIGDNPSLDKIRPMIQSKIRELIPDMADPTEDLGTGAEDESFPSTPTNPQWPPR